MITRIFFVRHGEINNPTKIIYGRLPNFELTKKGREEMNKTAKQLSKNKIAALYASPLLRTKQSADIINNVLHLPTQYSDYLLEVDSPMTGRLRSYVLSNTINYNVFATEENKSGETIQDVAQRMQKFINEIKKNHRGENVVAVTHGDPIMIVRALMEKLPLIINSLRPIEGMIGHGKIYEVELNS